MSRATWYRQGKPTAPATKPVRPTQQELAAAFGISVRSIQRSARIQRLASDLAEKVEAGRIKLGEAEEIIAFRRMLAAFGKNRT